jgi:hypothetical protein
MAQSNDDKSPNIHGVNKISDNQQIKKDWLRPLPPEEDRSSFEKKLLNYQLDAIKKNPLGEKIINYKENLGEKIKEKFTPFRNFLGDKLKPENEEQSIIDKYNKKPAFLKTEKIQEKDPPSSLPPETLKQINLVGQELSLAKNKTPSSNPLRSSSRGDKGSISR